MSRPLRSTPITGASSLLRAGPPARPHRYSTPHSFCCSTRSLSPPATFPGHRQPYRHTPSHVPCSSCRSGSRRLHTGHHLASKRVSARFIPKIYTDLGFDVVSCISMLRRRFALARLPDCLLYTSDAADEEDSVDLGGRRIIKKKKKKKKKN